MSWQLLALDVYLRMVERPFLAREDDFVRGRARMVRQAKLFVMPSAARWREAPLAAGDRLVRALRMDGPEGGPVLLWIHGGAYIIGAPETHAAMAATLALKIGGGAVLPDYRLAPEHPFPAAVEDVAAAWRALRAEGVAADRIVLGGDSAGGGLALALLHGLVESGEPLPGAVVAFSPWADLTESGESLRTLAWRDALIPVRRFAEIRDFYLAGADPRDPRASPIFGRFEGAPPVMVQSSRAEVLRDDARMVVARLREQGVAVTHDEWDAVPHVWQIFHGRLPEADAALDRVAEFLRASLGGGREGVRASSG